MSSFDPSPPVVERQIVDATHSSRPSAMAVSRIATGIHNACHDIKRRGIRVIRAYRTRTEYEPYGSVWRQWIGEPMNIHKAQAEKTSESSFDKKKTEILKAQAGLLELSADIIEEHGVLMKLESAAAKKREEVESLEKLLAQGQDEVEDEQKELDEEIEKTLISKDVVAGNFKPYKEVEWYGELHELADIDTNEKWDALQPNGSRKKARELDYCGFDESPLCKGKILKERKVGEKEEEFKSRLKVVVGYQGVPGAPRPQSDEAGSEVVAFFCEFLSHKGMLADAVEFVNRKRSEAGNGTMPSIPESEVGGEASVGGSAEYEDSD